MKTEGSVQKLIKVSPELSEAISKYGVSVTDVCRRALKGAVFRAAGKKAMGVKPSQTVCPYCEDRIYGTRKHWCKGAWRKIV